VAVAILAMASCQAPVPTPTPVPVTPVPEPVPTPEPMPTPDPVPAPEPAAVTPESVAPAIVPTAVMATAQVVTGTVTVTFTPTTVLGDTFVVERQVNGVWGQVATWPRSPIAFRLNVVVGGTYRFRVRTMSGARVLGPPSNVVALIVPGIPTNVGVSFSR